MKNNLIVCIALRRSGTTQLFRALRQAGHYCLDEPFNPKLHELPKEHGKLVWAEFITRFQRDPNAFRERFSPTLPTDELSPELTDKQVRYIRWLVRGHDRVFVDTTRCQFKLRSLHEGFPHAMIVHLFRSPENFATSHLLPRRSGVRFADRLHQIRDRIDFFQRTSRFDSWGMEQIVNAMLRDERFHELPLQIEQRQPAYLKLMAYWWVVFQQVEEIGRTLFAERFCSLRFGDFCDAPQRTVSRLLRSAGFADQTIDCGGVRHESSPYCPESPKWAEARRLLGIPLDLDVYSKSPCTA